MSHPHGSSLVNYGSLWINPMDIRFETTEQQNKTKQRQRTNKQQQNFFYMQMKMYAQFCFFRPTCVSVSVPF